MPLPKNLLPALLLLLLAACTTPPERLPYLGERDVRANPNGGPADTIFATAPAFRLVNQDSKRISNADFAGRIYLTDFFFATCPGICPKVQSELLKVYQEYATDDRLRFVSFTIDPAHDTVEVLKTYAQKLGVPDARKWHFATFTSANRDSVFALAKAYFTAAQPETGAPGGFAHAGNFALIDDQDHIRGLYDSLNKDQMLKLRHDLPLLLAELDERRK